MRHYSLVFIAGLIIVFSSCTQAVKEKPISTYYDVEGLVDDQVKKLVQENALLAKKISINGKAEQDTVTFDSLGWINELGVFKLADINKPTLRDLYKANEKSKDGNKIWSYKAEKQSLGIEFLNVYFGSDSTVKKLEARYNEDNSLYSSERNMEMAFENVGGETILTNYKIYGKQKMIMKDEVEFSIESEIL
ncbi:hypothetical protein JKA74_11545 [Marivirga sp. S37H4]|uniref:Lipoprotein n=1 Tax=Marivirga aurantiaca TaxID=2802615 RepID=A0A934WYS6_9BACT|nr:hypothetical protein [Marivirga aurantiaca]MBK6265673.1 hypothetical protein [Marivirga aurantiaca]